MSFNTEFLMDDISEVIIELKKIKRITQDEFTKVDIHFCIKKLKKINNKLEERRYF